MLQLLFFLRRWKIKTEVRITRSGELYHYGVKGMKWGVRKAKDESSSNGKGARKSKSKPRNSSRRDKNSRNAKAELLYSMLHDNLTQITNGQQFIDNSHVTNLSVQQANQFAMQEANRAAINASLQASSLSMSGGMNPFMFGMM